MPVLEATSHLLAELRLARAESDRLFAILTDEAIYDRPIDARHRVIFYLGHLDGFDSIQICREGLGLPSPDAQLDNLFQAGIDPDASHLPSDQPRDWPSIQQVVQYVTRCREHVDRHLSEAPDDTVFMALEHRLMHLETLAYMFHNFDYTKKRLSESIALERTSPLINENTWIEIPAGNAALGKPDDNSFGWDNEYGEVNRPVPAFQIQKYSVTNGEYLRFVEAGAPLPNFWTRRGNDLLYRGMFEEIPLPLDWPVYVMQKEAAAYAQFVGKSIPTEEQFHCAAYPENQQFPWGERTPSPELGNFDFRRWDPEAVTSCPAGASSRGVHQMVGNGWQWTNTVFAPLPGFAPRPSYPGYSANFFDDQHYVIKGGSARTAARLLRRSFRNWFRADYPYVYAAFRCVEN